jgi:hypothetical protein
MTVAHRNDELEYLRNAIRWCLRADSPRSKSALADMQTRHAKGEQKLKPAKGPWTQQVHATPTRAAGYSRENITEQDYDHSKMVKAIWSLHSHHIQNILTRYSPSPELRESGARHLATYIMRQFRQKVSRPRARVIAYRVLTMPHPRLHEAFGLEPEEWRTSSHKKLATEVRAMLNATDVDAVIAWSNACAKK